MYPIGLQIMFMLFFQLLRGMPPGPYNGMSSFIFGLGSVVFNLCLINRVHVYTIGETLQKKETGCRGYKFSLLLLQPKVQLRQRLLILNMYIISECHYSHMAHSHAPSLLISPAHNSHQLNVYRRLHRFPQRDLPVWQFQILEPTLPIQPFRSHLIHMDI